MTCEEMKKSVDLGLHAANMDGFEILVYEDPEKQGTFFFELMYDGKRLDRACRLGVSDIPDDNPNSDGYEFLRYYHASTAGLNHVVDAFRKYTFDLGKEIVKGYGNSHLQVIYEGLSLDESDAKRWKSYELEPEEMKGEAR